MNLDLLLILGVQRCIGFKGILLVAKYEEGNSRICVELWYMSTSKDRTLETCRGITVIINFGMEMGGYFYGFYDGITQGKEGEFMSYGWSWID
jgi:hypothetical protein